MNTGRLLSKHFEKVLKWVNKAIDPEREVLSGIRVQPGVIDATNGAFWHLAETVGMSYIDPNKDRWDPERFMGVEELFPPVISNLSFEKEVDDSFFGYPGRGVTFTEGSEQRRPEFRTVQPPQPHFQLHLDAQQLKKILTGLSGRVTFQFTINPEGLVEDPVHIGSTVTTSSGEGYFETQVLAVVVPLRYGRLEVWQPENFE